MADLIALPERALTLWQPWAWLVAKGHKDIENRPHGFSFKSFRGDFWIHAGRAPSMAREFADFEQNRAAAAQMAFAIIGPNFRVPNLDELDFGAIIGRATISGIVAPTDSHEADPREPWHFPTHYGFKLESAVALAKPVPCRGFQGFWRVPGPVLEQLREAA